MPGFMPGIHVFFREQIGHDDLADSSARTKG
jgi:hypothetical protein